MLQRFWIDNHINVINSYKFSGNFYLRQLTAKVVAIFVHKVIPVSPEIFAQLVHDSRHILLGKVSVSNVHGLPVIHF